MAQLTNVASNNAAAVVGTNMNFATPMAYLANLPGMNAGNYRFIDFVRMGMPLILLLWIMPTFIMPWHCDI